MFREKTHFSWRPKGKLDISAIVEEHKFGHKNYRIMAVLLLYAYNRGVFRFGQHNSGLGGKVYIQECYLARIFMIGNNSIIYYEERPACSNF